MKTAIILAVAYILNVFDYFFTNHWIKKFGLEIEANPIGRWMFENNVAWVFKIVVNGILFTFLHYIISKYPKYNWVTYIPLVAYGLLALYHIFIFCKISNIR